MMTIEINAIQRAKRLELKLDENICINALCECIRRILGDESTGRLIYAGRHGFIPAGKSLSEYGIGNGTVLIYISKIM